MISKLPDEIKVMPVTHGRDASGVWHIVLDGTWWPVVGLAQDERDGGLVVRVGSVEVAVDHARIIEAR